ncbi:MAG: ATP-binding protein [Nitrospinota bacterium]|nr:ATP-binding protein [Nitrospinota bacterium]
MIRLLKAIIPRLQTFFSGSGEDLSPQQQSAKRQLRRVAAFGLVIFFTIVITAQLLFQGNRAEIPVANNLLILFLLNINIILLIVMVVLVGRNLVKLYLEREGKAFVKKFQTKLVISFITITLIPSLLLFIVASGLITNSVDNWFNETVEDSLKDSLEVAETLYTSSEQAVSVKASKLAQYIQEKRMLKAENAVYLKNTVSKSIEEYDVERVIVFDKNFEELAHSVKPGIVKMKPMIFDPTSYFELEKGTTIHKTKIGKGSSNVYSLAPIMEKGGALDGAVFLANSIDRSVVEKINAITKTFDEYKQLKLQKFPIKAIYEVTLLLITMLIFFAAIWYGFYLAREITVPIYKLAEAMEKVTEGNLTVRLEERSKDEIGFLINSFNRMTAELESSRSDLVVINMELDRRRKYIETILAKITTGVVSVDNRGRVTTFNSAATMILKIKENEPIGKYYEDVLDSLRLEPVRSLMREMGKGERESIEMEVKVTIDDVQRTLLVHVSTLKDVGGSFLGLAVVFDDLTALINAQKTAAWRDIAQFMAHEIKNPLTPIRLNTERLIRQYKQGSTNFSKIFESSTRAIIQEVDVLKKLVDEFRKFAQLPEAKPTMVPLHEIISDVIGMYKGANPDIKISHDFDASIGLVRLDAEQIHRVFRNLIENSIDAITGSGGIGEIDVQTRKDTQNNRILIEIQDTGPGIDANDLDKIFLPYFSLKKKGSGLGLAIVNRIIADHEGHIRVKNRSPHGTIMAIDFPIV